LRACLGKKIRFYTQMAQKDRFRSPIDAGTTIRKREMTIFENGIATSSPVAPRRVVM
jgi:hypothetical protein